MDQKVDTRPLVKALRRQFPHLDSNQIQQVTDYFLQWLADGIARGATPAVLDKKVKTLADIDFDNPQDFLKLLQVMDVDRVLRLAKKKAGGK